MAIAFIAHGSGVSGNADGFTTGAIDTTGANFLIANLATESATVGAFSDSKSNTWAPLTQQINGNSDRWSQLFYAENATIGSGHTFSIAGTGIHPSITMAAFSGVAISSSFDAQNSTAGNFGTSVSTGSVTPAGANELLIAGLNYDDSFSSPTVDSGFAVTDTVVAGGNAGNQLAYLIETTATAKNPTFSWTNNARCVGVIAAFKAAASGGGSPLKFNSSLDGLSSSGGFFRNPLARSQLGWRPSIVTARRKLILPRHIERRAA